MGKIILPEKDLELQHIIEQHKSIFVNFLMYGIVGMLFIPIFVGMTLGFCDVIFGTQFLFFDEKFIENVAIPLMVCLVLLYAGIMMGFMYLSRKFFGGLDENICNLYNTEFRIEELDEIIQLTNSILGSYRNYIHLRRILWLLISKDGYKDTIIWLKSELSTLIPYLINLTGDLKTRVQEQSSVLQNNQSRLSKLEEQINQENIGNKANLTSSIELQKSRLDGQIEQFQELQKILIKI